MTDTPDDPNSGAPGSAGSTRSRARPSGADRARDEMIADIDGRLRDHERETAAKLDDLNTITRESAGWIAEAFPRLDDLAKSTSELAGRLDQIAGRAPKATPIRSINWPALSADDAEKAWNELADWVGTVLGPWYQILRGQVPDCWALHRTVMLQLSWLHRTWLAAHAGPDATPTAAAEWHIRWLPAALAAISAADAGIPGELGHKPWSVVCRPGYHLDPTPATERGPKDRHLSRLALPHEDPDSTKIGHGRPRTITPDRDPIDRRAWHHFWAQAVADDLAWRRQRDNAGRASQE